MEKQLTPANNFEHLFNLEKIEKRDVANLNEQDTEAFFLAVQQKLDSLDGAERNIFLQKISAFVDNQSMWELSHQTITREIASYVARYGEMPLQTNLAKATGLSAPTIRSHMKNYIHNPAFREHTDAFRFMVPKILSVVMGQAIKGDLKAAKLFLHTQGQLNNPCNNEVVIENQNHYVQINNTVINQQVLQQLKPEQLQQIEEIIKNSLPEEKE